MVTQYWTKFNVAAMIVSVLLFFIINRITQSNLLFQKAPLDYPFIGKILLKRLIIVYFHPSSRCDPVRSSSGVFDQAFASPVVWLTALLTAWTAVLPSVTARALSVILKVHDKRKVRQGGGERGGGPQTTEEQPSLTWNVISAIAKNVWTQQGGFSPSVAPFRLAPVALARGSVSLTRLRVWRRFTASPARRRWS